MQTSTKHASALRVARSLAVLAKKDPARAPRLALLQYSLKAKSVDFSKILAQIDGMMKVLAEEQKTDDETKAFCSKEISAKDAEQKDTEEAIAQSIAAIEEMTES